MSTVEIIQLTIAVYLLIIAVFSRVNNNISAITFKFIPFIMSFALGLMAFKVIV